jgi:hypothetical protein
MNLNKAMVNIPKNNFIKLTGVSFLANSSNSS